MKGSASMSKQSDGFSVPSKHFNFVDDCQVDCPSKQFNFVDDCQVDCLMTLFLPLSITYHDFTDWNYNAT
jgi:hypothetical protein